MWNWQLYFDWWWLGVTAIIAMLVVLPLLIWKSGRLTYASVLSLLCMMAFAFLWMRDASMQEDFCLRVIDDGPVQKDWHVFLTSGAGGFCVSIFFFRDDTPKGKRRPLDDERPTIYGGWRKANGEFRVYPGPGEPLFDRLGFALACRTVVPPAVPAIWRLTTAVVFPDWFAILIFSIIPVVWIRKRFVLQHNRQKHGFCLNCGYDLRATADKCPECGIPVKKLDQPEPALEEKFHELRSAE